MSMKLNVYIFWLGYREWRRAASVGGMEGTPSNDLQISNYANNMGIQPSWI